jgi:peptidyl-prolyl cis-trans isomerase SurA
MILKIFNKLIFLILMITVNLNILYASNTIKIVKKVNEEIVTNFDIKKELNYLRALNNNLDNLDKIESYKIAEESLIREKIKYSEILKFVDIEKFNNKELIDKIMFNIMNGLNLTDKLEFENYLNNYQLKIADVEKKILIEVLWNQLIASRYSDKININENELLKRIRTENLNRKNIVEYDLSEIVFQAKNQDSLKSMINQINISISNIGFENTANKFSIANTSKFGGKIGKINENQLSKKISIELDKLKIGEYTKPLKVGNGFLILLINNKNNINREVDEETILNNMIKSEKEKQFESFSQIYFNKVKINTNINEF